MAVLLLYLLPVPEEDQATVSTRCITSQQSEAYKRRPRANIHFSFPLPYYFIMYTCLASNLINRPLCSSSSTFKTSYNTGIISLMNHHHHYHNPILNLSLHVYKDPLKLKSPIEKHAGRGQAGKSQLQRSAVHYT